MQLEEAALRGSRLINDVIYAETSVRFDSLDNFETALAPMGVTMAPMPPKALFLAGKALHDIEPLGAPEPGCFQIFSSARALRSKVCRS